MDRHCTWRTHPQVECAAASSPERIWSLQETEGNIGVGWTTNRALARAFGNNVGSQNPNAQFMLPVIAALATNLNEHHRREWGGQISVILTR